MSFWIYILRCADDSYYIGHTDDLEQRIGQHQTGAIPGYTHNRRPVMLVFSQELQTREEALAAERQVKGWTRAKKEALIQGDWKRIRQLAWGKNNPLPEHLRGPVHPSIREAYPVLSLSKHQGERDTRKIGRSHADRKEPR